MILDTNKETICINKIIGQKSTTSIIEEDFVVPDIKPDILNAVSTSGTVCIYKKEILDGKVRIDGSINTYVMYLADTEESQVRSMNVNLDFSQVIDFEGIKIGMMIDTNIAIKQIECRVLNGRKINVRAIVDIDVIANSNENIEFINDINNTNDIQVLRETMEVNSLLGNGNTKIYAKDTIVLNEIDEIAEILKSDFNIINKETKISYNKILVKADCSIKIIYLTQDNRICTKNAIIPIMGFIDMLDVNDDALCDIKYEIKNILLKANNIEDHSIYTELEIDVFCNCYTIKKLNIIKDLYSTKTDLNYKQNTINTMSQKNEIQDIYPIRNKTEIEDIKESKIYDVDVKVSITNKSINVDRIVFDGDIELNFISSQNDSTELKSNTIILPFNYSMSCPGIDQDSKISSLVEVLNQDFVVMPDESIDVKLDLKFTVNSVKNKELNLINEIEVSENRNIDRCSIIIYFIKPGDTLWKIAKRFKSTVDSITSINEIDDTNNLKIGSQLFIPLSC